LTGEYFTQNDEAAASNTQTEEVVCRIWKDLLQIQDLSVHDNFFDVGGHSLLGMQITSRLRSQLCPELAVRELFDNPTVSLLARRIDQVLSGMP